MVVRYKAPELRPHYIKQWLVALDISQQELADRMGIERNNVTRWIKEPWRVNLDVLSGIAAALGMRNPDALLRPPPKKGLNDPDTDWSSMSDEERERAIRLFKASED